MKTTTCLLEGDSPFWLTYVWHLVGGLEKNPFFGLLSPFLSSPCSCKEEERKGRKRKRKGREGKLGLKFSRQFKLGKKS